MLGLDRGSISTVHASRARTHLLGEEQHGPHLELGLAVKFLIRELLAPDAGDGSQPSSRTRNLVHVDTVTGDRPDQISASLAAPDNPEACLGLAHAQRRRASSASSLIAEA